MIDRTDAARIARLYGEILRRRRNLAEIDDRLAGLHVALSTARPPVTILICDRIRDLKTQRRGALALLRSLYVEARDLLGRSVLGPEPGPEPTACAAG